MINRRRFIKTTGSGIGFLALSAGIPAIGKAANINKIKDLNAVETFKAIGELTPYIIIDPSGQITIYNTRPEMGQGTWQSIPTILAEELDVNPKSILIKMSDGHKRFGEQWSGGSSSIRNSYMHLRTAGAAANQMLRQAAANQWSVSLDQTYTENGMVINKVNKQSLSYGALVNNASALEVPKEPKLKSKADFKYIGKETPRADIPLKTKGKAVFGIDSEVPGMVYAAVVHSPYINAKVESIDDSAARAVNGVTEIFKSMRDTPHFNTETVAIIAKTQWAAIKASRLVNVKWTKINSDEMMSTDDYFKKAHDAVYNKANAYDDAKGNFETEYSKATKKIEAVYETPFAAHMAMEPNNSVVWVKPNEVEIWAPVQGIDWTKDDLAEYLKVDPSTVKVYGTFMGGAFGRKGGYYDYIREAALLSKKLNAPVKLLWTRETDTTQGPFRPGMVNALWGGFDEKGNTIALHHKIIGEAIQAQHNKTDLTSKPDDWASESVNIADSPYDIPNRLTSHIHIKTAIPVIWWRSVYASTNAFGHESFIDELAHAAGKDPLDYRMDLLQKDARKTAILKKLEELSDYRQMRSSSSQNIGVAIAHSFGSTCAHAVIVSKKGDGIKIDKVITVMDCGQYVNPNTVRAQTEGNVIMGITAAIKTAITFKDGMCEQSNFHNYNVMRINESPAIEVHVMDNDEAPGGAGEPGLPPIAPALCNAIFNLKGVRIRKLPFDLTKI